MTQDAESLLLILYKNHVDKTLHKCTKMKHTERMSKTLRPGPVPLETGFSSVILPWLLKKKKVLKYQNYYTCIYLAIKQCFFISRMIPITQKKSFEIFFLFPNYPKNLDPSYKMDL